MIVGQKLLECMLEKHGNMKILPNTQRLGKLTFNSNQVRKSKTNPNVLVPIIGRFKSTNPERLNQYGPDLPRWAIDPNALWGKGPSQDCLEIYKGDSWK